MCCRPGTARRGLVERRLPDPPDLVSALVSGPIVTDLLTLYLICSLFGAFFVKSYQAKSKAALKKAQLASDAKAGALKSQ